MKCRSIVFPRPWPPESVTPGSGDVPRPWGCSVGSWTGDFGVLGCSMGSLCGAWAVFGIGACVFGDAWWGQCLEIFWDAQWGRCLELWECLGMVPAVLGMQTQDLGMFDGVGTPCFRDGLWGRCPGFWECLAPWNLEMPNRFNAWGFKDGPWGQCLGIYGCFKEFEDSPRGCA